MFMPLPPIRLTGAQILRDGAMQDRSIALADGKITKGPLPAVDLTGYYVLPGVVDMMAMPPVQRRGPRDLPHLLREADRAAAVSGVTTQFLCQGWSWEGECTSPASAENLLDA